MAAVDPVVPKSERFFDRIFEIPLISTSYNTATNLYEKTKNSNSFVESTFNLVENFAKTAYETSQPIRHALDGPIVLANKVACQQLSKLEEKYPDVKITPDQIVERSKNYYESSSLKTAVDSTVAIKDYALDKGKDVLKFSESLLKGQGPSTSANGVDSYLDRLRRLVNSATEGVLYRIGLAKENLSIDFEALKKRAQDGLARVLQITSKYEADSEKLLLNFVHYFARSTITISDALVNFSKPFLTESSEKLLDNLAAYIRDVNQAFIETESLKEVKATSVEEAKSGFEYIWSTLASFRPSNKEAHSKKIQ